MGSFGQTSFAGGEWDSASQGRLDHPWLRSAMAVSVNGQAGANGAWHKRSGTKWLGPTYKRLTGIVRSFESNTGHRYEVVLTTDGVTGWAHFFLGDAILTNATNTVVSSSSSSGILTIVTNTSTGWAVDDQVLFTGLTGDGNAYLNRWLTIDTISTDTITLKDDTGTAFTFDSNANVLTGATVKRIARFTTGIISALANTQIVNLGAPIYGGPLQALLLNQLYASQLISLTEAALDTVTITTAAFVDGPYLAATAGGSVSAYSGSITYTPSDGTTFTAADIGRHIRLYHEPAAWASGTAYTTGQQVTYNGGWWKWIGDATTYAGVTGVTPGTLYTTTAGIQAMLWAPVADAGRWAWGTITAQAGTSCTVSLTTNLVAANGATITSCRLGEFYIGVYPQTGIIYLGRLYLGGCREGSFSAGKAGSGVLFTFSPTDIYGQVYDDAGFTEFVQSGSLDQLAWFKPDARGLLIGTFAEEFLLSAGDSEVITPFNKTVRRVSSYGSAARPAVVGGFSVIFLQHGGTQIFEYLTEIGSSPSGRSLNEFNYNIVHRATGFSDITYTKTRIPVIWARASDGQLFGATYQRTSHSMASDPDILAWGRHRLADGGRLVVSLCSITPFNDIEYLILTTSSSSASYGAAGGVERLMPFWLREEANTL